MIGGRNPTAAQKRWRELLAQTGCVVTRSPEIHIHHCEGSAFKHKKIWVGEWWVLPLRHDLHMHGEMNVTDHKAAFHEEYGSNAHLLRQAKANVLAMHPDAETPPYEIYELADDYYRVNEDLTDWYRILGGKAA